MIEQLGYLAHVSPKLSREFGFAFAMEGDWLIKARSGNGTVPRGKVLRQLSGSVPFVYQGRYSRAGHIIISVVKFDLGRIFIFYSSSISLLFFVIFVVF